MTAFLGAFMFWCPLCFAFSAQSQSADLLIQLDHGKTRMSADINQVESASVFFKIEQVLDCRIISIGSDKGGKIITDSFSNLPIEKGIKRLAKGFSLAIVYNEKHAGKIKEIWMLGRGKRAFEPENSPPLQAKTFGQQIEQVEPGSRDPISEITSEKRKLLNHLPGHDPNLEYWTRQLFYAESYDEREQSITELQRIGTKEAAEMIAATLGDEKLQLRQHAVRSLTMMADEKAIQFIGQALLGDPSIQIRQAAIKYFIDKIGYQNDQVALSFVKTALNDRDEMVQTLAQNALSRR